MSASRQNALAIVIGLVILGGLGYVALRKDSDVVRREVLDATVKSLSSVPHKPNAMSLGTSQYMYMIDLGPEGVGFVWDTTARPHAIGATIKVERQTRVNGTVTFAVVAQE